MFYSASLNEFLQHILGHIDGNRKPDTLGGGVHGCVNANYLALNVQQRSTRVTRVDGGICLHQVLIALNPTVGTPHADGPAFCTQHTDGYGVVKGLTVGIADGNHPLAWTSGIGITKFQIGEQRILFCINDAEYS